jgi:hypothetical protein
VGEEFLARILATNGVLAKWRGWRVGTTLGTTSARSSMTTRPIGLPPAVMSKNTLGLAMLLRVGSRRVVARGKGARQHESGTLQKNDLAPTRGAALLLVCE